MTDTAIDVDPQVYYDATTALTNASMAFARAVDDRWSALADCEQMAGSYDDAKTWAGDYDARANEAITTSRMLWEAAWAYCSLLGEMGYNHAMADWSSVIGNTAPQPAYPPLPDWLSIICRPDLPSAGGPGNGLVAQGLSGAVDLLDEIGVVIPDGDTGKLGNAARIWSEMAADQAVTNFAAELNRIADMFATVTTPEAVFIDEDLRRMATAATEVVGQLGEIGTAVNEHLVSLQELRNQLKDQLIELGKEIGKEVLIGIGLSVITAGFGAALATARGAAAVKKFAGPIRALVVAFKSAKITKGVKTTHTPATHQPTLAELAALKPTKAPTKPTAAPKTALTQDDHITINSYTGMGYRDLNQALRNPLTDPDAYTQQRIDALNQALGKLPDHQGPVVRHTNLPEQELAKYQPGQVVVETGFTSTTKNPNGAGALFEGGSNVEFQIISKTGKDVSGLSKSPEEMEVLFRSGTPFACTQRWTDPATGRTFIRLVEQ
ncbi:ADP-ribosyltransferase [Nocardia testacea]|uniref:ADP-ribosyltransferase n=1 Tax=Nocardia testacea TaxID=248551 RepID=UPI0002E7544C|nr:ADP-ribosyltransferase [Nocardia testacea]